MINKILAGILLGLILIVMYVMPKIDGAYFPFLNIAVCNGHNACVHEEGHMLDQKLNQPSQTKDFRDLVGRFPELLEQETSCLIKIAPCFYAEIYAQLYVAVGGNVSELPESFRKFYED